MKLVFEADSLAGIVEQAQKLVDEYSAEPEAAPEAAATAAPKRGRGRPPKSAPEAAAPIPGHMTEATAAANASKAGVTKEALLAAATKLIETKGEEFAAALLAKNYLPSTRFSEIPPSRWAELVAEVEFILSQKEAPPAKPSLI